MRDVRRENQRSAGFGRELLCPCDWSLLLNAIPLRKQPEPQSHRATDINDMNAPVYMGFGSFRNSSYISIGKPKMDSEEGHLITWWLYQSNLAEHPRRAPPPPSSLPQGCPGPRCLFGDDRLDEIIVLVKRLLDTGGVDSADILCSKTFEEMYFHLIKLLNSRCDVYERLYA